MCKNAAQRHHAIISTVYIFCVLVVLVPRAECNASPALDAFFDELDNNHDGAIDANEATRFIGGSIGGQEFDEPQEAANAAASFLHAIDGGDAGLTVSVDELDVHLHSVLSGVRVWEWIRHGVGLSQYADAFRQHSITPLDFPVLVQSNGQVLEEELGVRSPFHRSKVVRAIQRQILGLGSPPAEPRLLACSGPVSGPTGPRVAVHWLPPAEAGNPPLHRYVLEVAGADGQWHVMAELDDPEPAAVLVDVPPTWEAKGASGSAGALSEAASAGGGGGGGVGGVAASRRVLIRVSAWNLYGRSPYGTAMCDLGLEPPPGYPHVSRVAETNTNTTAASAAGAANATCVTSQELGVRDQSDVTPAPGTTEAAAAAAGSLAVGAGGAHPRSAAGGLAAGGPGPSSSWDAALAAASHAVCSASAAASDGVAWAHACPSADPVAHHGNVQQLKHGQVQHGPLDRHHASATLQLLMQQQPQQQKWWYGDGGASGGAGGSVVRPASNVGGSGSHGAERERSPPPRSLWSSLLLAVLPWLLRLLPVPLLRALVEGAQRRLLWLLQMFGAPPPTWLVQQPPRRYDGALAAAAVGGGGSDLAAGPPEQSLAAAALGRNGAGAASSVAVVAHIAGGAAAGPSPTANGWPVRGLQEGVAGLPITTGTASMTSSYTSNDKGRPPPYRLSSAATAPSGLGGVFNEASRLATLSMAGSVGSRGGSMAGAAAVGAAAVSYRGGGASAIPPRSGSEGDLGTCSSAPGPLSRQLHHQQQHHEQSQPDQLSLRNHSRPFPGSAPALGVLATAAAANGPLPYPQQHQPRGDSINGGSVAAAVVGRRSGYGDAEVPGPGAGARVDADWADSELQAAIAAGKMCAILGCRRKLDLRHMRDYLRRHYCGRCQKYVCHVHTAFSPHGDMGSCDYVSSCVCTTCFAQYTPERQRALQKLNKLTQSAASPPRSGQGAAPLAAQGPAQPQHSATLAGPDDAGGKSSAKLMWERAATKLKAVTRFRGKGYRWKRTASMEPVVE